MKVRPTKQHRNTNQTATHAAMTRLPPQLTQAVMQPSDQTFTRSIYKQDRSTVISPENSFTPNMSKISLQGHVNTRAEDLQSPNLLADASNTDSIFTNPNQSLL